MMQWDKVNACNFVRWWDFGGHDYRGDEVSSAEMDCSGNFAL
jgi:hypothetical protein